MPQKPLSAFFKAQAKAMASYNKATGWMRLNFPSVPDVSIRTQMKQHGFRYKPRSKSWSAKWAPFREEYAKKLAGTISVVNITPNWAAKATRATQQAAKHRQISEARSDRAHKIMDSIPFGQPILVGHHSERHHRADLKRIDKGLEIARREADVAEKLQDRAERFEFKAAGESAGLIFRRIQKLEADERRFKKNLEWIALLEKNPKLEDKYGYGEIRNKAHWQKWIQHTQEQLAVQREAYKRSGGVAADRMTFKVGEKVMARGWGTVEITKINRKTIVGKRPVGQQIWERKIPKSDILRKV